MATETAFYRAHRDRLVAMLASPNHTARDIIREIVRFNGLAPIDATENRARFDLAFGHATPDELIDADSAFFDE